MTWLRSIFAAVLCSLIAAGAAAAQTADIEKGKLLFERCAACHSLMAGQNDDAPTLANIFGRKIASIEEYRYSAAMKRSDVVWSQSTLATFLEDPQAFIPGNRMPFDGIKDKAERDNLLAYLEMATKPDRAAAARAARNSGRSGDRNLVYTAYGIFYSLGPRKTE